VIFLSIILILTLGSVIGMIIHRNLFIKFFLCFESFFFIISVIILIWSCSINGIIIILYLLWNSTFEVILGLTISLYLLLFLSAFSHILIDIFLCTFLDNGTIEDLLAFLYFCFHSNSYSTWCFWITSIIFLSSKSRTSISFSIYFFIRPFGLLI